MIVLVGFMGAGKTTVGRALADALGSPFVDTDEVIERSAGQPVSEIFRDQGEGAFRSLERDAIARALEGPPGSVVSVGGGAIHDPTTCAALEWHTVIYLDVSYPEAMRRVGHDAGRPMLHFSDPRALFDERAPVYARLATHAIPTDGADVSSIVERILEATGLARASGPSRVVVDLGDRSYPVLMGPDLSASLGDLVELEGADRAVVITHPNLARLAKPMMDSLVTEGIDVVTVQVEEGESSKRLAVAEGVYEQLAAAGLHRGDVIVAFGGGVVCDLAAFVASTYHRGVRVVQVPTSLLAQVDAAIGGKTAVNLAVGKNLVGTFHQPVAVVCDVGLLRSLPEEELRSGLAEVIKYGFISDPSLLDTVSAEMGLILDRDEGVMTSLVRRCVAIKAAVVSGDEREGGRREVLNYGHTFGHAIEHVMGMRHGDAISIGMVAAAHLSHDLGILDAESVAQHAMVLGAAGLPVAARLDVPLTLSTLSRDKKNRARPRFVVLDRIGHARTGVEATEQQVETALRKVTS